VIESIRASGRRVEYFPDFDRAKYIELLGAADYLLYTGFDEGAVSVSDALAMGVRAIASAQGFHLELGEDVILFADKDGLMRIARRIADEVGAKNERINRVSDWGDYAQKHLDY